MSEPVFSTHKDLRDGAATEATRLPRLSLKIDDDFEKKAPAPVKRKNEETKHSWHHVGVTVEGEKDEDVL